MNKTELAEKLYNLIVIEGRWGGNIPEADENSVFGGNTWDALPDFLREIWEDSAVAFAASNYFGLED